MYIRKHGQIHLLNLCWETQFKYLFNERILSIVLLKSSYLFNERILSNPCRKTLHPLKRNMKKFKSHHSKRKISIPIKKTSIFNNIKTKSILQINKKERRHVIPICPKAQKRCCIYRTCLTVVYSRLVSLESRMVIVLNNGKLLPH